MAEAEAQDADTVMTQGTTRSDHAYQTTACGAKIGMSCHLLREDRTGSDDENYDTDGNLLVGQLHGATTQKRGGGLGKDAEMEKVADRLRANGRRVYAVPGGGSNPAGALGDVDCAFELVGQANDRGLVIDH